MTATPNTPPNRAPPAVVGGGGGAPATRNMYPTPSSAQCPIIFDSSLFSMEGSGGNVDLSEPMQPAVPSLQSSAYQTNAPRLPIINKPLPSNGHPSSTANASNGFSPTTTNGSYYTHIRAPNKPFSGNSSSAVSANFTPDPGSSPSVEFGLEYTGNTTPEFEEVDMPPLADDGTALYDDCNVDSLEQTASPSTVVTGRLGVYHPPSPRPTVSPSPGGPSATTFGAPAATRHLQNSPIVKVEKFTPQGNGIQPSPHSQRASGSSSCSGFGDVAGRDNLTVARGEDGSWRGLDPVARREVELGLEDLQFSLKDQEIMRLIQEKNADIEDWLRRNSNLTVKPADRKRSRSVGDFRGRPVFPPLTTGNPAKPGESSAKAGIPPFDEDEDTGAFDYEDDSSVASSFREGSLDDLLDDPLDDQDPMDTSEEPPSETDLANTAEEEETEQKRREADPQYYPNPNQFHSAHPWYDVAGPATRGATIASRNQPNTANAAIIKFYRYAENIETASRVATFGSQSSKSRRLSAGDADRFLAEGLLKRLSFGKDKDKDKEKEKEKQLSQRRPSMWGAFVPKGLKRGFSNAGDKEKEREEGRGEWLSSKSPEGRKRGNSTVSISSTAGSALMPLKSRNSWTKLAPKSPLRVDTTSVSSALAQMASIATSAGRSSAHAASAAAAAAIPAPTRASSGGLMQTVKRARSKSDISSSKLQKEKPAFGIVSMLGQYGGPPALPIRSPVQSTSEISDPLQRGFTFGEESRKRGTAAAALLSPDHARRHGCSEDIADDGEMEDGLQDHHNQSDYPGMRPPLPKLDIVPNHEGFTQHVLGLTPALPQRLVERVVQEQSKRYRKLVEHRQKHLAAIKGGKRCSNSDKCRGPVGSIGPGGDSTANGHKRKEGGESAEGEVYSCDEAARDDGHSPTEGKVNATQFPPGVPQPPVLRLPSEFECPICFKVKAFSKPSDWTKHVHEDVQPFTCTFEDCREPKSFKRKADWVRHENERHRHLEWWTCTLPDCSHTCYRKDNFVQHLVREHKMAEPKLKAQKAAKRAKKETSGGPSEGTPSQEDVDEVWKLVNSCHQITTNLPSQEKCRFCGSACQSWKKLTVHLARHMEQMSLPVLDLINDDSVIPPGRPPAAIRRAQQSNTQPKPEPSRPPPAQQSTTEMELDPLDLDPGQTQLPIDSGYGVVAPPRFQSPEVGGFSVSPAHAQYTPPRNSPIADQYVIHASPPQFAGAPVSGPGQSLRIQQQQQHPSIQLQTDGRFEFPDHSSRDVYSLSPHTPTRSGVTTPQGIPTQASGLVNVSPPPPPGTQYPPHCSPLMNQFHGEHQILHQPQYFAYGHASGQIQGAHGQVHSQAVAHANSYGFYPQQIAHSDLGIPVNTLLAMDGDEYLNMGYPIT